MRQRQRLDRFRGELAILVVEPFRAAVLFFIVGLFLDDKREVSSSANKALNIVTAPTTAKVAMAPLPILAFVSVLLF